MFADAKGPFPSAPRHRLYGVYPALVRNVVDPDRQGRVQVELSIVDDFVGYGFRFDGETGPLQQRAQQSSRETARDPSDRLRNQV